MVAELAWGRGPPAGWSLGRAGEPAVGGAAGGGAPAAGRGADCCGPWSSGPALFAVSCVLSMVASVDEEGGGRDRHHRVRGDGRSAGVPARETAMLVWRRRPGSGGLAIAMLVYFLLESISITVDQWFAGAANPTTTVASAAAVPVFAIDRHRPGRAGARPQASSAARSRHGCRLRRPESGPHGLARRRRCPGAYGRRPVRNRPPEVARHRGVAATQGRRWQSDTQLGPPAL
jgi:hypothetical protein